MHAPPAKERAPVGAPEKYPAEIRHETNHLNGDAQPKSEPGPVAGLIAVRIASRHRFGPYLRAKSSARTARALLA
jgi:hypothetical protein